MPISPLRWLANLWATWILLDAETWAGREGSGIAFAKLADTKGYFGRAVQNILIEKRQ